MVRPARPAPGPASRPMWGWALAGACAGVLPALLVFAPAHWLADSRAPARPGDLAIAPPFQGPARQAACQLLHPRAVAGPGRCRLERHTAARGRWPKPMA